MIRCIYMIEAFNEFGELLMRRFARNKRTATRIARRYDPDWRNIRKLNKDEMQWVSKSDVE